MKKYLLFFIAIFSLLFSGFNQVQAQTVDYEKYGKIAMAVIKTDYPSEAVTDYQYLGREKLNETDVLDSFKFTVKENGKPLNVVITVKHNMKTNKLISLAVEEVKQ